MEVTNQSTSLSTMNCLSAEGKSASQDALASLPKVDDAFLDAVWSTQPSLERDFALHSFCN